MYKISIWLKGGGKITEECEVDHGEATEILDCVEKAINDGKVYGCLSIKRNDNDIFPIHVAYSEIAAIQIDENKRKEPYHGRRLDSKNLSQEDLEYIFNVR